MRYIWSIIGIFIYMSLYCQHASNIDQFLIKNYLYLPGEYIESEKNVENIIISGKFNEIVKSPVEGKVTGIYYVINKSLQYSIVYEVISKNDIANKNEIFKTYNLKTQYSLNDLSIQIDIKTKQNEIFHISGLGLYKKFRSGDFIKIGDTIGYMNYFYYSKINNPCYGISMSKQGKSVDPSIYFGIKNHNNSYKNHKTKSVLEIDQALEDINILRDSFDEAYPGIYDYRSKKDIDSLFETIKKEIKLNPKISIKDFYKKIVFLINKYNDSHISILNFEDFLNDSNESENTYHPPVYFGWLKNTAVITRTILTDSLYFGRQIKEINRISVDSIKKFLLDYIGGSDGKIQSYKDFKLLISGTFKYYDYFSNVNPKSNLELIFQNGDTVVFKSYINNSATCFRKNSNWREFFFYPESNLTLKFINNDIAYIAFKSFEFTDLEKDSISFFFREISKKKMKNLIIDIRNNYGGDIKSIPFILNFIADTSYMLEKYSIINNKRFNCFKYAENQSFEYQDLFSDYKYSNTDKKFYKYNQTLESPVKPNFDGKVYVLTSERTESASTIFAGLIKKNKLGVVVGRETPATFHQINGEKFANLVLPNSHIIIRFPLVKYVYEKLSPNDANYGRGVLPDYNVDISLEELSMENGDIILNKAISLINEKKYLVEKNESESFNPHNKYSQILKVITILIFLIIFFIIIIKLLMKKNG